MNESTGKLILRLTLGILILLHDISKLFAIALALIGPGRYAFNQK